MRHANFSLLCVKESLYKSDFFRDEFKSVMIDGISNLTVFAEPEDTNFFPTEIAA
jgi:hypothetical protein